MNRIADHLLIAVIVIAMGVSSFYVGQAIAELLR